MNADRPAGGPGDDLYRDMLAYFASLEDPRTAYQEQEAKLFDRMNQAEALSLIRNRAGLFMGAIEAGRGDEIDWPVDLIDGSLHLECRIHCLVEQEARGRAREPVGWFRASAATAVVAIVATVAGSPGAGLVVLGAGWSVAAAVSGTNHVRERLRAQAERQMQDRLTSALKHPNMRQGGRLE